MKWFRKRIIPCLLLFSLIFSTLFSLTLVPVSAAIYPLGAFSSRWELVDDETATIGPLKASQLTEESRNFLREWQEDSSQWIVVVSSVNTNLLYFYKFPGRASYYFNVTSNSLRSKTTYSYDIIGFDLTTGDVVSQLVNVGRTPDNDKGPIYNFIQYDYFKSAGLTSAYPNIWKPIKESATGEFTILFDDEISAHTLSIDYQYADGTEAAPSHVQLLEEGSGYEVPSPEIPGYTPDKPSIAGEMGSEDEVFTVTYIKDPVPVDSRTLTIYYLLADGSQTAEPYSAEVAVGADYSVPSPVVSGYQTDRHTVSGTMGETDEVITVIYTPLAVIYKHTLTIRYQTADGRELAPVHSALLAEGEPYSVASPVVTGYQPDRDAVFGAMGTEDVLVTVIYTSSGTDPTMPGVDVSYQFEDGSAAAPACRKELSYGQFYWIASPSVPGYTPDRRILFGTVPRNGIDFIVTYRKGGGLGGGTGIPWLPSGGGGIQWEPPAVSGLPYLPSDAGGIPWKP